MMTARRFAMAAALGAGLLAAGACAPSPRAVAAAEAELHSDTAIAAAVGAATRTEANRARDRYRHPRETLGFFGVKPTDTLVEIWPGGGWYTEILAPLLREKGNYYAAANGNGLNGAKALSAKDPVLYGNVRLASFPTGRPGADQPAVPAGSADVVLTFRNVHNWIMPDQPFGEEAFRQMFAMLKPGGTLGVVEHRLPESADPAREKSSGYIKVSTVRRMAEAAGFRLAAMSEINANPADTKDHPNGVWSLPPALRGGDKDREKFVAIGESDRMTLRFVKPGR
ncbi:MAG TPA: methyltransferase [Allosphingosinicella sp.]|jgi:predicted methyltransferase